MSPFTNGKDLLAKVLRIAANATPSNANASDLRRLLDRDYSTTLRDSDDIGYLVGVSGIVGGPAPRETRRPAEVSLNPSLCAPGGSFKGRSIRYQRAWGLPGVPCFLLASSEEYHCRRLRWMCF